MPRDREKTKGKILDVAASIVEQRGLAALTINGLAREAHLGKPLIYRYFSNLDGVAKALWHESEGDLRDHLTRDIQGSGSPLGRAMVWIKV